MRLFHFFLQNLISFFAFSKSIWTRFGGVISWTVTKSPILQWSTISSPVTLYEVHWFSSLPLVSPHFCLQNAFIIIGENVLHHHQCSSAGFIFRLSSIPFSLSVLMKRLCGDWIDSNHWRDNSLYCSRNMKNASPSSCAVEVLRVCKSDSFLIRAVGNSLSALALMNFGELRYDQI